MKKVRVLPKSRERFLHIDERGCAGTADLGSAQEGDFLLKLSNKSRTRNSLQKKRRTVHRKASAAASTREPKIRISEKNADDGFFLKQEVAGRRRSGGPSLCE